MPEFRTFTSQAEREQWLIENADYFSVVFRRDLKNNRLEFKTLSEAEYAARRIALEIKVGTIVYAVSGVSDTFVKGYVASSGEEKNSQAGK